MNKSQLAKHFQVDEEAIVGFREVDGGAVIRALIDYGIAGVKVYETPKEDIAPLTVSLPAAYDLNELSYRELQALAKEAGISASQSAVNLRAALEEEE